MTKIVERNESWATHEHARWEDNLKLDYSEGVVFTKWGLVDVYRSWYPGQALTMLELIYEGKTYRRQWDACFSKRYCMTLAKRFSKGILDDS